MSWTLIEPCCGAASLATHISEVFKRTMLPYQGSKWKLRKPLAELLVERGFTGPPSRVQLVDIGPWGHVWQGLLEPPTREQIIGYLDQWAQEDPHEKYMQLHNHPASTDPSLFAAEYLFLQRLSFSGKALSTNAEGNWKSPGFNTTSAYGSDATPRFGAVNPMIPSLVRTLRAFKWENTLGWSGTRGSAADLEFSVDSNTVVYLDPPYQGSTLYPVDNLPRADVIRLAQEWDEAGALVILSEAEAVDELGWESRCLIGDATTDAPFRGNSPEWITFNKTQRVTGPIELGTLFFGW